MRHSLYERLFNRHLDALISTGCISRSLIDMRSYQFYIMQNFEVCKHFKLFVLLKGGDFINDLFWSA